MNNLKNINTNRMKNLNLIRIFSILVFSAFTVFSSFAQISGTVFRDFNGNGTKQSAEPLVIGVIVTAYNSSGTVCGTATTTGTSAPNYTISGCTGQVRVEFEIPATGCNVSKAIDYSAYGGQTYGSSIQFVTSPVSNVNYALHFPGEYGGSDAVEPNIYTTVMRSGDPIPVPAAPAGDLNYCANQSSVIATAYMLNAPVWPIGATEASRQLGHNTLALAKQTGIVWGNAFSPQANRLFVSAFIRRHAGMGPLGPGGIYMINPSSPDLNASLNFANLDALGFPTHAASGPLNVKSNAVRQLPAIPFNVPSYDVDAYDQIGKVSLGDLELSDNGRFLFTINLYDRKIYRIDLQDPKNPVQPTAANVSSYTIPNPCSGGGAGEYRPFGLGVYRGKLYVGVICSGQDASNNEIGTSAQMSMNVYEYDLGTTNTPSSPVLVFSNPMSYRDTETLQNFSNPPGYDGSAKWSSWFDYWSNVTNAPMLTDIEFDNDGNMLLGLTDRNSYQTGSANFSTNTGDNTGYSKVYANGDILKLQKNAVSCGYSMTTGSFLHNDFYDDNVRWGAGFAGFVNSAIHNEIPLGATATHRFGDKDEVELTALSAVCYTSNGIMALSNDDGSHKRGNEIWFDPYWGSNATGVWGKAGGLGDIEIFSPDAPLEIGNRIWHDIDMDGIQDADEPGIAGVAVQLYSGSTLIATATTDANGNYIFSSSNLGTSNSSFKYNLTQLVPGMDYTIKVPLTASGGLGLTLPNSGSQDLIDSDADASGNVPVPLASIAIQGANNHSFDIGYTLLALCDLTDPGLTNLACNNAGTGSDPADDYITFSLNPTGDDLGTSYTVLVNNGGTVTPTSGTYGSATNFRLQNGSASGATYTITITDADDAACTITTTVSSNSCSAECLLLDGGLCAINCSNTGSDDNGSNDFIMFDLNPSGINIGGTYNVTVNTGSVTLANGNPATGIAYGSVKSFRLQNGSAGAGNVQVTVTDVSNPACSITFTLTDPGSCSGTNCADAYMINPGESFTATAQTTGIIVSTIQWYKSTNGGVTFTPIPAPAGTAQNLVINAEGHYYYTANGLDGCKDSLCCHIIVIPANCYECQLLNAGLGNLACNNNNTPPVLTDDYVTFTLNPQGSMLGSSYTVTVNNGGSVTPSTGTYGAPSNFRLQNGSANGTLYTLTITDNSDAQCQITATVQQDNCGVTCDITTATVTEIECHNNNTNGNTADDHLTFKLTVTGNYTGSTYIVSVSSGSIVPTTGTYNTANLFTLGAGSAGGGDITITITDINDPNCTIQTIVNDPGHCSYCDLQVVVSGNQSVCQGDCTTLTATPTGGSGPFSYAWSNGFSGPSIQVCPVITTTYTVTVTDNYGCTATDDIVVTAAPCPFDLALKLTTPRDLPVKPGDVVPFVITVCNQSNITVESYEITDYIPAGLSLADPTWTAGTDGHTGVSASKTFPGPLVGGQCVDHTIYLIVNPGATRDDFVNYAEISYAIDVYGHTDDIDSDPATDAPHELAVGCGDPDDDNMNGKGPGAYPVAEDEDDHDPACLPFFDLALTKVETSTGPYRYGDNVTFTMTITNQGNVTAKNIRITDYVPDGFEYIAASNPLWTQAITTTPGTVIAGPLAPDATTTVTLVLKLKSTTDLSNGWVNRAEISRAENLAGVDISNNDYDSWLDPLPNNDAGGHPDSPSDNSIDGDGTGSPNDTNPATDEDDADPARVKVYDLALTKKLMTPAPYEYYQDMTFEIEVFNQGNEIMKDVVVSDYIPAGYTFSAALNAGWTGAAPTVSRTIAQINPGQSVKIQIVLKLVQNGGSLTAWDNYAEIVSAKDNNGVNATTWDSDSNPGSDSPHERAVTPGDADDNNINGHYIPDGTDEDDHDPAGPEIFDLALRKVETSAGPYRYGDNVTFTYTVFNQGNTPAKNIEVMDYVPSGFEYDPALNPTWTQALVATPKRVIAGPLAPGASTTITLVLIVQPTNDINNGWTNKAEIVRAEDSNGNNMTDKDIDSQYDNDPNNDAGGTPDTPEDDLVTDDGKDGDGDGVTDEDDADPARVKIYDLALTKKVITPKPYTYYQDLTFEIEVFNQGNEIMKDVVVNDYIPAGYTFSAASNTLWTGAAPTVSRTIAQINPGQSVKIQIVLKLVQTDGGELLWDNYAEVASAKDNNGNDATLWDADSNPNTDSPHERAVKPGDADDDNINGHYIPDGTDEDDHDPAGVEVLDLALTKTANVQAPFQYDQIIDFVLTIYNQGNEIAHDIRLIDYVPAGYIYLPHLNPDWTQSLTNRPETVLAGPLAPGASITKIIKLQLQYTPLVGGYVNEAEIRDAKDEQNNPFDDIDSDPDNNPNNDVGGTPNTPEDDNVDDDGKDGDGDGVTDEDDHDPWTVPVASIGNYVWYDNNDDGIQNDGLPGVVGVAGVTVILENCIGSEVLRTLTNVNGFYEFKNLIPGNYNVRFTDLPANTIWAKQNIGNDALDSDPDANGLAGCTTLDPGEDDPTWDAGILKLASLGDYVWLDTDNDGIQDPIESSVSGVTVRLLDANGNIIATTTTNEQGFYLFDSLRPGTYFVQFVKPNGLEFTLKGQGGDVNKDSDANPADGKSDAVTLTAGQNRRDIDAGLNCTIDVLVSPDVTICQGETVTLSSTVTGGAAPVSYLWSTSQTTPSINVTPSATKTYTLTVTDKYGCEDTDAVTVNVELKAKIGDYVWFDKDRDGIQDFYIIDPDLDEDGINGVTVNLYKASDPNTIFMTQLTHTNADTMGFYEFDVCAGDYIVEFIKPTGQGYIFTLQDQGPDDGLDSDADFVTGRTIAFHVNPGQIDHTRDAGFYLTASIGDRVWHDIDADGIQDPNEPGIGGVTVTLRDGNSNVIGTTTTNSQGYYEFSGLIPDDYYVCFDIAGSGYTQVSPRNQGVNDAVDSDADPVSGCTEITTIVANENDLTWDLGLYNLASLGDYVWLDKDADGCQEAGETGIQGVVVRLYKDGDANGVPDGAQLAQTTTNATGYYIFNNLIQGTYLVKFDKPSSLYKPSPKNNNSACDDTADSDGDAIFGYSDPIPLGDNEHDPTIDQGYYQTAKVGDYVWYDIDGDGIQDANEPGVPGVIVTLYKDTDGDGIPDTAISTKVTNSGPDAGKYLFDNVDPGVYKICFDAANTQYEGFTKVDQGGNDATDSDASLTTGCTPVFTVQSGDVNLTFDAGLIKLAELGDYVWEDRNADGYQDPTELPIANVKVELLDVNGNVLATDFTDADGLYKFEDLYPGDYIVRFTKPSGYQPTTPNNPISDSKDSDANPVSGLSHIVNLEAGESDMTIDAGYYKPAKLGDYVWEDKDADGIQDPNENGINGIVVTLYDGAGNPLSNTTTGVHPVTGEDGYYIFDNLKPGSYYVCFDKGTYDKFSPKDTGVNDAKDSDADPLGGCTIVTVLESGETDLTWDAGLYNLASLGDYVWLDNNTNGIQDVTETGINGIVVNLYKDTDKNGNPDGAPINTTTTFTNAGKQGYYIFDNLEPGDYVVMFAPSAAYARTVANAGSDDAKDSDANVTTGLTNSINLESGEHDPTIDAGYYYAASLGDYTWYDIDGDGIQDANEKCLDSVKIKLYRVNTDPVTFELDTVYVGQTWSHSVLDGQDTLKCGFYEFTKLQPGKYFLIFENPDPVIYNVSPKESLFNRAIDSNPNKQGNTSTFTLNPGEHNPTIDAGFYEGDCLLGVVWEENVANQYNKVNVYDSLDYPVVGIQVDLVLDNDPFITTDDEIIMTDLTNAEGIYEFYNIPVGNYFIVLHLPAHLTVVNTNAGGDDINDNDFYLNEDTGQYRSQTFDITANNDEECKIDIKGGTGRKTFPSKVLYFEAVWDESQDAVVLEWGAMDEVNLNHYMIEKRAESDKVFEILGEVNAKGGLDLHEYEMLDPNVEKGMRYYYKLVPVDNDGRRNQSYPDDVIIPGDKLGVIAYPNPTKSLLNIEISGKQNQEIRIEVIDNVGRKAIRDVIIEKNSNIFERIGLDMSPLPQGNYFIKVISGLDVMVKRIAVIK